MKKLLLLYEDLREHPNQNAMKMTRWSKFICFLCCVSLESPELLELCLPTRAPSLILTYKILYSGGTLHEILLLHED
jgi:hypothetical protein